MPIRSLLLIATALLCCAAPAATLAARALEPEDWLRLQTLSDLQIAPDGDALAYLVTRYDRRLDESRGELWLVNWAGGGNVQLTRGESVSEPRFSPDGRYLSFLSARSADGNTQLWLLDRHGGEPRQLTHLDGEITGYAWSPDGGHVVLVAHAADAKTSAPRPLVIDAFQFKDDERGYLTADSRTHLLLLDVHSGAVDALATVATRSDSLPAFSPDGRQIAYVSNEAVDAHAAGRDDIFLVAAAAGAQPRLLLSTWSPNHQRLEWSPDGRLLAFLQGDELRYNTYIMDELAVADVSSGHVRRLTQSLDRAVQWASFAADGRTLQFVVEDDGSEYPAQVNLASGAIERLAGTMVAEELAAAAGHTAVLASSDRALAEVYALEHGRLRALTTHNGPLLAELSLGTVEDIAFASADGTRIHGHVLKPDGFVTGRRYPTILWIHGGPNGQDEHSLALGAPLARALFVSHGYLVLAVNYRGSTGRGAQFARSIQGDWGHKEVEDLLAGLDYVVQQGLADPTRLGVGGWSYGAILTDYLIASDTRFKAAISGAGSGNQIPGYGTDEYILSYNGELGPPWRDPERWLRVSYPFFHADRIRTPTLFLGGDTDFNVPVAGSEQMYQALRTLGVATELVVYPGESHSLSRPSFLVDRSQRYLDWMAKYLGPGATAPQSAAVGGSAAGR